MEILLCLALLLAPWYALYRVTQWCCPWGVDLLHRLARVVLRLLKQSFRLLWSLTWTKPARAYGIESTLWLWTVGVAMTSSVAAILVGRWEAARLAVLAWALALAAWWLLRLRAVRRHRPRVLPARHERR